MLLHLPWELVGVIFAATSLLPAVGAHKSVNVALQASFNSPPYLLELLETAAQENESSYFPLLDKIAEGHFIDLTTDQELYTAFLQTLRDDGHLRDPDALSSFDFALSVHTAAPRIEAHYQYYNTSVEASLMVAQDAACPVWVHFGGKQYCSPTLDRAQQDFVKPEAEENLPFDRTLSLSSELPVSVLYVDINSPLFGHFHENLSRTARSGQTSYRVRYRPSLSRSKRPLVISGYGVELALKRTDYIVIDDRDAEKKEQDLKKTDSKKVSDESEDLDDLKPIAASELLGLGFKTSSFIMDSAEPLDTLLKVSQDFPKYSSRISKLNTSLEFVTEHGKNRETFLPAGYNMVWMNGMQIDARQMDAFGLLEQLRHERKLIGGLRDLGLSAPEAIALASHPAIAESTKEGEAQRYDYRDALEGGNVIIWLNDIEKDKRYQDWPIHASALLQRMYPGQLPTVRRDIHNLIIPLDLTDLKDIEMLVENLLAFVKRLVPIRFGVVPLVGSPEAAARAKIVYHLLESYGLEAVVAYLEASIRNRKVGSVNDSDFQVAIKERDVRNGMTALGLSTVLEAESLENRIMDTYDYLRRLGIDGKRPVILINGAIIPRNDGWMQSMSSRIELDLRALQKQVFEEVVADDTWLAGQFLETAVTHRNALVIPEDENTVRILNIGEIVAEHTHNYHGLPRVAAGNDAMKQFWSHLIVIADLDTEEGTQMVLDAMEFRKQQTEAEIVILHNPSRESGLNYRSARMFQTFLNSDQLSAEMVTDALIGVDPSLNHVNPDEPDQMAEAFWLGMQPLALSLGVQPGQRGIILNGRLLGPIPLGISFSSKDCHSLLDYERLKRISPANTALAALGLEDKLESPLAAARASSLIALSTISDIPEGIFDSAPSIRMNRFQKWNSSHTAIQTGDLSSASIQIVAAIDPTSEATQRWVQLLRVISELNGVHMKLFLNPRERMQEIPVKRFYRYVLGAKPSFNADGGLRSLEATFHGLPKEALLNLGLDVPPAWLVAPKESIHDLDNIKLSTLKDGSDISAVYELEHILIEGHSRDTSTSAPPRGVQLLLGSEKDPHFADTLIMANLGYFQFKANPGYWSIQLQSGRSQQIFNIESAGSKGYAPQSGDESTHVALMSFQGLTLFPRLSRKPGEEMEDVLEEGGLAGAAMDYVSKATRFASSFLSNVGLAPKSEHTDINIFSVASGHLYERMLNIMMVSVMRHTKHSVKFWFIEQFLSPSFKASLPHLAAHYSFSFEMVTYKWPHWLRSQKEKQREIWGYKILFLDVLFPLSLDKVIFVDADQIVRTDMYDLVTHDLQGAPYAFTPMCDSRTEMEGFRFWKQGYWKSFLRGLPYHISALYVVDLKKFRQMAAGDRLRQQYHQLSADPNSLSNLDQDLPNHMQMSLPIHSLPQEWLWCETWCSDENLAQAKTIDLCNNPLTKEPKLERARRQVPEWTVYDEEIAGVLRRVKEIDQNSGKDHPVEHEVHAEREIKDEL